MNTDLKIENYKSGAVKISSTNPDVSITSVIVVTKDKSGKQKMTTIKLS